MNESEAGKCNEEFFTDVIPIEPVLGEMDYTNTREVTQFCLRLDDLTLVLEFRFSLNIVTKFNVIRIPLLFH